MGLNSGSIAEFQPSARRVHRTFRRRSACSASLSISHLRTFSERSARRAPSYAARLSFTSRVRALNGEDEELVLVVVGVRMSISPVMGLMPCTPR